MEALEQMMEVRAGERTAAWKLSPENAGSSLRTMVKMGQALQTQLVGECKRSTLTLAGQAPFQDKASHRGEAAGDRVQVSKPETIREGVRGAGSWW